MPQAPRARTVPPGQRLLSLPPLFRLVLLREGGDAFDHACAHASELGAGTLVFVGRFDLAEFAIVLEPDEPLATARLAVYAGMVALGDALAAAAPPEKPIAIDWPDAFVVDRGLVGGGRLGWPHGCEERAVPDWLVFGAMVRMASRREAEVARHPRATALAEEGFEDVSAERLAERFARHLMVEIDRWQESGFAPLARDYLAKLILEKPARCEIADNGDLLVAASGAGVERHSLAAALQAPSWLDPATSDPSLVWPPAARR